MYACARATQASPPPPPPPTPTPPVEDRFICACVPARERGEDKSVKRKPPRMAEKTPKDGNVFSRALLIAALASVTQPRT